MEYLASRAAEKRESQFVKAKLEILQAGCKHQGQRRIPLCVPSGHNWGEWDETVHRKVSTAGQRKCPGVRRAKWESRKNFRDYQFFPHPFSGQKIFMNQNSGGKKFRSDQLKHFIQ